MSFNEGVRSASGRVRSGGGRRAAGLGGGSLLAVVAVFLIAQFTGVDVSGLLGGQEAEDPATAQGVDLSHCTTGADANAHTECRMVTTADSLDTVWTQVLTSQVPGVAYEQPGFMIFLDSVSTACGGATSASGPFYCPGDKTVYLDLGFFQQMETDFGASAAPLAQEYVVAHEWGHHIQNLLGTFQAHDSQEQGDQGAGVRMELQADCYAGVWMNHASSTVDPDSGEVFLRTPSAEEIAQALQTAAAIGDDRLQEKYQGHADSDTWTHGSAEQRQRWLTTGLESGSVEQCDTFAADRV
ncbi:MAG: neutral zinc metallopeptidase [Actinomyces sp.]|nr:neutral zinc metallopeptidase [Actinomyces sp.]